MADVRVVIADLRSGWLPGGRVVDGHHLIVLADDAGHRALPLWLRGRGAEGERNRELCVCRRVSRELDRLLGVG